MRSGLFQYDPQPGVVPPGSITNGELANMAALTVKANATNATASPQDVAAASNDTVFRRTSDTLNWGGVTDGMLAANTLALSKLANAAAQYNVVGRKTAAAGAWQDCTRTELLLAGTDLSNVFTVPQSISNSSATPPFTITQTGANAGPFFIGDGFSCNPTLERLAGDSASAIMVFRKARGSLATPTVVNTNDAISQFNANAYTGVGYTNGGQFRFSIIDTTPGASAVGMSFAVRLAAIGGSTLNDTFSVDRTNGLRFEGNTFFDTNRLLRARQYTVATLPAAGTAGRIGAVTDALAPTYGAAIAGGGAVNTLVYDTGAAWTAH